MRQNFVMIVHGSDGLDEITITGRTSIVELKDNNINEFNISPKDFGLSLATLDDIYANAIFDYMLYRAYQKDTESASDLNKATLFLQSFQNSMGIKSQADTASSPKPSTPTEIT